MCDARKATTSYFFSGRVGATTVLNYNVDYTVGERRNFGRYYDIALQCACHVVCFGFGFSQFATELGHPRSSTVLIQCVNGSNIAFTETVSLSNAYARWYGRDRGFLPVLGKCLRAVVHD